jgi:hypothetical protein
MGVWNPGIGVVAEAAVGLKAARGAFVCPRVANFVAVEEVQGAVLAGDRGERLKGGAGAAADLVGVRGTIHGCVVRGVFFGRDLRVALRCGVPDLIRDRDGFHDDGAVATPGGEGHGVDEDGFVLVGRVEGVVQGGGKFDEFFREFALDHGAVCKEAMPDGVAR